MYRSIASGMVLIILAGYFLFAMKREVEALNFSMHSLSSQINEERSAISMLRAEFSHLTSPARLKILSETHLKLSSLKPKSMVSDPLLGNKRSKLLVQTSPRTKRSKAWRYKHLGEKNIHRASYRVNVR